MSKIVSTIGVSHSLENLILQAREYILIVTPYLKFTSSILGRLSQADRRGIKIIIIYGKSELSKDTQRQLKSFKNLNLYFLKDLHAKCYLNELEGIITSMNLYEYSQVNNWELGLLIEKDDIIIRDQLMQELELMVDSSTEEINNFDRFNLVEKSYVEKLSDLLNYKYNTKKFHYSKETDEFLGEYYEEIIAVGILDDLVNLEITNEGTRVDFELNILESTYDNIERLLNINEISNEYRIYQNQPDVLSMYYSVYHRDKWDTYSNEFKIDYMSNGIDLVLRHIYKKLHSKKYTGAKN